MKIIEDNFEENNRNNSQLLSYANYSNSNRVILNARGIKYEVRWSTLCKLPNTRLGKLKNSINTNEIFDLCDDYDRIKNEFYFERDPFILNNVLNYYSTGKLHVTDVECVTFLKEELIYWGIDIFLMKSCCGIYYFTKSEEVKENLELESKSIKKYYHVDYFSNSFHSQIRKKIWNLFEKPSESIYSKVYFVS